MKPKIQELTKPTLPALAVLLGLTLLVLAPRSRVLQLADLP